MIGRTGQLLDALLICVYTSNTKARSLVRVGAQKNGDSGESAVRDADLGFFCNELPVDRGKPLQALVCHRVQGLEGDLAQTLERVRRVCASGVLHRISS
jgi:hypothetical protein